ncbi:non-ribosomal peptide synthetase [Nocardia caishijiensis]|uniref:Non-ribosomal peptide synthase protein (TIGR01720 family)/amino acid adenylation domain-containing protein n=1 Tax=Nocardia caishijiensis TaxID=184756 RepID=A0ABQ6YQT1_9NOCA|nr:non-ribosomal peptide synthetase [Nocardia caishijiensis]KAF0848152.1 non-ribosomal peptide synthase protein (TIGR01720 family)/amino acid adenylation domain-containing protein [Nocardia caishijiensis]
MTRASRASGARARQRGKTLPQLLSVAVESNPGGLALSWSDGVSAPVGLTYGELDERANRLARLLIARGVGPEDVVAVGIGRSPESVLAMWAVTKAGAAFLPVDPNYPLARVSHMLADAGAVVGLSMSAAVDRLPATVEWLCLDDPSVRHAAEEHSGDPVTFADRVRPLRLPHPAYVVYTSGSTGLPKGVVVTHAGLAGYCAEQRAHYGIEPTSRTLHFASPSFDAAVLELLMAVGAAATMVIAPAGILGGAELAEVLRRESVTHMFITTAALASLDPTGLDELAVVTTGGEACPPDLIRRWATGTRRFHDCYGPTETTIVTNISAPLELGDTVNIGAPLRGVTEYVLDERLVRVPDGMIGELYIAGSGLARGYHRRPALTASRFVTDPFDPAGGRMYRTGDLVRRRPDGAVEFVGRNDFQVKVRGFRIELGEIDTVLTAHEAVDFAVTVGHELDNGTTILAAYVHPAPGAVLDVDAVLAHAKAGLPAHMVPTALTVLDTIPLTPVGKLDRAALPAPTLRAAEFRRPSGAMEELVAAVFTDLLHPADPIGADDDFFALGGNSLLATRVAARLGAELSTRVPAGHVFESPTVAGLAALLEPLKGAGGHAPLTRRGRPELIPLSPAQQRMWFLNQFDPNSTAETIPFALRLTGPFDANALYAALSDLVGRHESLRTWYPVFTGDGAAEGVGHQVILPAAEAVPEVLVDTLAEDELPLWLAEFAATGFDVAAGVPLRVALAELGPREHVVAIALHHITADGASITPLLRDLLGAYLARRNRSRPSWAPLPVQYADYTLWHREVLGAEDDPGSLAAAQIAFWRDTLTALPDRLDLPTDRPRPPVFSGRGAEFGFQIPATVHTALADLAQRTGTSEFMVVHTALAVLLSRMAHTDDIAIGTPVAGRGARELDDLIGMFVNTLVLRTQVDQRASFLELLRATKRADLAAFAHADLPFERLVELIDPVRSQAHHPLFQVALFFQNLDLPTLRLPGMEVAPVEFGGTVARFDLQLTIVPGTDPDEPMAALFTYATDLFDAESVERLAGRFTRLLAAVTAEPSARVAEIDLLTDDERHQSIVAWNDTAHPVAPELMLDAYRRAVQAHPSATALVYEGAELTYQQFDERVNALARVLIAAGVGPESLVGLAVRRSPELVIGMYAVVTAGGAYVPLDPDHPADRVAYILDTARPACVVSTRADTATLPSGIDVVLVDELDTTGVSTEPVRPEELRAPLRPEHPAYVIFTSGSTGKPKGVLVSHAAIHNQLVWMLAKYPLVLGDVYLQKTATTFDVSLWGYFLPLRVGATLLLATPDGHRDPAYLIDLIDTHRVTVTDFVPSMLTVFAAQARAGRPGTESAPSSGSVRGDKSSGTGSTRAPLSRRTGNSTGSVDDSTSPPAHGLGGPASAAPSGAVGDRVTRERLLRSALAATSGQNAQSEPPAWSLRAVRTLANPLPGPTGDAEPVSLSTLRDVFVIGEALPPETVDAMAEVCPARLHNLYGPTEAAVSVTYWPARAGERTVPIGLPQWNTRVYVLDERLRPVPPGVAGELYLAGDQLARGYVARPGLSADRFVADPFAADFGAPGGARMYRTGDLVVWRRPTGGAPQRLDYLGRVDFQVKFRGQRIELGEIETALLANESVSQAVAVVAATELGDQLVAYVVPAPGRTAEPDRLLTLVSKTLPAYMVPAAITVLDELPLNPSGKLDRKALPAPHFSTRVFRAPATPAEKLVAGLYGEVLGRKDIGADDDFFALGGNSLVATRLVARLGVAVGGRIPVRTLFEHPSVAALAATLDPAVVDETVDTGSRLGTLARPAELPLSPAQRRMWFLNRFDQGVTGEGTAAYNLPFALRLTGNLDVAALTTALYDVLARHEVLRTVYPDTGDGPVQRILPADEVDLAITVHRIGEPADPFATTKLPIVHPAGAGSFEGFAGQAPSDARPEPVEELVEAITTLASTAFDVTAEVPLRVRLFDVTGAEPDAPREFVLAVVVHHIAADASSMAPLVRDVTTAYLARAAGHAPDWTGLPVQYADYALWQVDRLGAESDAESLAAQQVAFWRAELSGLPDLLELPADRPRPAVASLAGERMPVRIDAATHAGLARIAGQTGSTVFMVLHTAFAVLLARLAGTADVAVGTPVAGRGERELDDLIGMFVNTVVLRTRYDGGAGFTDLLADQRARDLAAFAAADVPFERLVEVLDPPRSTARHPLFQVGLSFQNVNHASLELPGLRIAPVAADLAVSQFDLHLIVGDGYAEDGTPTGIEGFFTYATDLFDAATVAGFAERLHLLLDAIVREPARVVGDVDLRTAAERESEIVSGAADLAMPTGTLADLAAGARPEAIALVADLPEGRLELTYAEFEARVNRLARHLISLGVGPETLVALALPRSVDLVVAMYAVARSGGAYLPIDPDQPADRTDYILHTAAPICVLTNGFRTDAAPVVRVDHPAVQSADPAPVTDADRRAPLRPENTAYVIFTSGSTGRPKGVAVPHAAVVNQLQWLRAEFATTEADAFLLKTPATFDLSVWEFWSAAVCGGRLVIAAPDGHRDPAYLDALVADANVTTLTAVPSLLDALVGYWEASAPPLRRVLAIGETLPAALAQRLLNALPDTRIDNLYGPTEAAVSITDHRVSAADTETVPIGTPEWNSRVYVLDERLRPVPPGVRGELYLGGVQLARGYLRKPALTAERFLADPFQPGARMYRTGDLVARRSADDALNYLGRTDFQVKVRGFRVEPGEVESALLALPEVAQAAVLARSDSHYGDRLVAYLVPTTHTDPDRTAAAERAGTDPVARTGATVGTAASENVAHEEAPGAPEGVSRNRRGVAGGAVARPELDVAQVKSALRAKLPAYLVPEAFVVLEALPRTVNGKLDRHALPAPVFEAAAFRAPSTPTEQLIAGVYADILGADEVGADDDFFALGGNSLLATRAAARIGDAVNRAVGVRLLFEAPTVGELALRVHRADELSAARPVAGPRPTRVPLSLAQQRMWLLNQLDPDATVYNIPAAIRLTGTLDLPALQAAVRDLFTRHEVLRTRYPAAPPASGTAGEATAAPLGPVQEVLAPGAVDLDLTPVPVTADDVLAEVRCTASTGFDVTTAPPVRLRLLRLRADEHVLVFVAHHIAADGFSMGPLTRDLVLAYTARTSGAAPAWTPLPLQYADYAVWQRNTLGDEADPASTAAGQLAYWTTELADLPDEIDLPTDRPRPALQSFAGATTVFEIDADLHAGVAALARREGVTVFMVVQAALATLLARLSGTDDVAIGTPIAGRGARELDDLVGMFVNTLVLRSRIAGDEPFTALLAVTRDTDLRAFAHADVPFERVVEAVRPARSTSRHPLFQVALSFENLAPVTVDLPGLTVRALDARTADAKFDLLLTVREQQRNSGMVAEFTYATDLFDESTVRTLGARFTRLLTAVTADPTVPVGDITLLDDQELGAQTTFAGPSAAPAKTLAQLMDDAVRANPSGIALRGDGRGFTYTDLDAAANQLARALVARGAGPEVPVAVAIRRSVESVLAVWAITRTGAMIVPIDPGYPVDRIAHMVADSGATLGVTLAAELGELPPLPAAGGWVALDDRAFTAEVAANPGVALREIELLGTARPEHGAYMIYTSGSTGLPKGVVVTHAGVANFRAEQVDRYRLDKSTRALAFASPSFDAAMLELLLAVGGSGTLVVAPADSVGGTDLAELIRTEGVTHAFLTPTVLATLEPEGLPDLRVLIVGGEHLPADLAARWDALPNRHLHNAYGPTEATIAATISAPLRGADVHMGGPIRGVRALILDPRLHPVPEGTTGELYVGGVQLARGYHQRPSLTAARFVADPHGPAGARLYRTGDLVRRRGDVLEFVGRNDFQVKIRGLRIELGEIDAVLAAAPGVGWVTTLGRDNGAGSTMLVSYAHGTDLDPAELTATATAALPDYMVPAAIVVLDDLPLTPSGKLDRAALPDPVLHRREFRAPRSSAERAVARVIGEVLGHDRVGLDDDFFALGGDSITAIQVVSRAADAGVTLRPRDLFAARTVAALAERAQLTAEATTRTGALPLTATAAQLLEAGERAVEPRALLLDVPADCPDEAVAAVAAAVMNQHPMLWAVLDRTEADPVLRIPAPEERTGGAFRRLATEDGEASLPVDDIVGAAAAALDPDEGRNIHFILTGDSPSTLIVVANALVLDEVSWRAVVDQLTTAWSRRRHAAPSAPDAGLGDLIRLLADYPSSPAARAEREYWHRAVRARTADSGDLRQRRRVSLTITGEGTAAVGTVAEAYRATVDEVLLTAAALASQTAADTAAVRAIGGIVRLRADQRVLARYDADNVVGGFTTDYPLALRLDGVDLADALVGGPAAGTALSQIKELCRTVPARGAGFGLLRYLDTDHADTVRTVDRGRFAVRLRDLRPARVHTDVAVDDLVLVLTVDATDDGMVARFDYAASVLDADAVKSFAEHWIRALGGLAEHGLRPDAGGFTPSDFGLVRLGQTELDRLVRRYPLLGDIWPVTPLQSGMLFHALLAENSVDPYITQFVLELDPAVDTDRLHTAAQTVLDRHDNLRVAFVTDPSGTPLQVVLDDVDVPWQVIDADDTTYERIRNADLAKHFDMATAPQLRFTLVRTPRHAHLLVTSHHILIDGWSMPLLLQELLAAYTVGRTRRLPKPVPYRDYLAWLTEQDLDAARQAWRGALAGLAEPTPLAPVDQGREIASGTGETGFALTPSDTAALTRLAADLGVTVNTVVQAAWGLLIARLVDRDDVVFGATVSGRPAALPGVERMVGLFLNAIPVRVRVRPDHTVAELLRALQDEQAALFDYHYLGLGEIQEIVGVDALFDSLVVFESFPVDRAAIDRAATGSATVTGLDATNGTHYPLTVQVVAGERLRVSVKYLRDVFDAYAAHVLAQRFSLLLARFTADPKARLGALDVLLADEHGTLSALNATDAPELLDEATLLSLFDAQVARTPDAVAVIDGTNTYTYAQFDARSRKLAGALSALGAGPEVLIAIAMRRGIDLLTTVYAVLRTGAAYVPVDPDHPAERTERVLATAAPLCVLTTTGTGFQSGTKVVEIDTLAPASAPLAVPAPDNLAYVIHTSGSTGKPKGVMLTHRQLVAQFRWAQRTHLHSPGDVVLHKTPVTFDISTWELLWPLQTGAAVVIARPDGHRDADYLAEVITEHSVTTVHFVPSMLDAFLTDRRAGELPSLRRVFAAGEALSAPTAQRFGAVLPGADLVNWYGPAEATVVTSTEVTPGEHISIGTPVANTRVHVLDRHLRPVPPGTAGELYLEGVQLARGYLAAPALTAERFVAHPGGGRLYRTGDVVRLGAEGTLEYLGRSDFQVKLRGQRIELGEVEAVLRGHPAVRHAAVALVSGPTGDRLVGYVVPVETRAGIAGAAAPAAGYSIESGAAAPVFDEAELLSYARTALPSYMVPATLVVLAALPLNASGKLDRKALPAPTATTRPYRPPTTPLQRAVAEVFAEVLGAGKVGLDDDFFELGGNSLVATKAISRLRTRVGADVRVQWFFNDATVAALAERIDATQTGSGDYDLESDDALGVLLPIRNRVPHGTEAGGPLFCVHPMYGLAWCYAGLAQYIPARRPIFGLQSPALSESGYLPGTLAEMARRYVTEIKAVQPQGPYRLMGWSLGGVLAHAVATELQAVGEQVSMLAMLDSHPDIDVPDFHTAVRDALAELGVDLSAAVATTGVRELSDEALAALHAIIPANMAVLTPERVRRIYRSAVRSAELIAEHRPAVFRGRLEYFSALGHERAAANWARYVDGEIRDRPIAVVHDQMTSPQALAEIGPRLAELLDAGDRASGVR